MTFLESLRDLFASLSDLKPIKLGHWEDPGSICCYMKHLKCWEVGTDPAIDRPTASRFHPRFTRQPRMMWTGSTSFNMERQRFASLGWSVCWFARGETDLVAMKWQDLDLSGFGMIWAFLKLWSWDMLGFSAPALRSQKNRGRINQVFLAR